MWIENIEKTAWPPRAGAPVLTPALSASEIIMQRFSICFASTLLSLSLLTSGGGAGEKSPSAEKTEPMDPKIKRTLAMKTLGGLQMWADVAAFHDWRIQKFTGREDHYRLLDGEDFRHCSGTREECEAKLKELREQLELPPMQGEAVILIHGIVRSSKSFGKLRSQLKEAGYTPIGFDYPSTRVSIEESAEYLHSLIGSLKGVQKIHFVVHSMGGILVRQYFAKHADERVTRLVMMGVPNRGAELADWLQSNLIYKLVYGPAGRQLISGENGLIAKLPPPKCEFAVIAGGRGDDRGFNPLLPGDDDGTVTIESARLPGAADFLRVDCLHSFLMFDDQAMAATVRFLKQGAFREDGKREPIPAPMPEPMKAEPKEPARAVPPADPADSPLPETPQAPTP